MILARLYEHVEEARADLDAAVGHLLTRPPATGLAKWSCLQAVEKVFKSFLHYAEGGYPKSHDLLRLYKRMELRGGPVLSHDLISSVQCPPSVRYDSDSVSSQEAVRAHFAALELTGSTALVLQHEFRERTTQT